MKERRGKMPEKAAAREKETECAGGIGYNLGFYESQPRCETDKETICRCIENISASGQGQIRETHRGWFDGRVVGWNKDGPR